LPVPARPSDLLQAIHVAGFAFSESRHHASIDFHTHDNVTLTMLREGVFAEQYRGSRQREHDCQASDLLIRPAGEPHADRFGRDGALNFVLEISPERLDHLAATANIFRQLSRHRDVTIDRVASRMQREFALRDSASALSLESLALELMAHLVREGRTRVDRSVPRWLLSAREMLRARVADQSLRVSEIAAGVGVHPVHFARSFREHYGCTAGAYVRSLRVEFAADAIANTDRPLSMIALETGFADQSHLTRSFRDQMGQTPGEWRRRHRPTLVAATTR
jgi:AraC family transcriptional regulator